jgi:hypothetical protein
MVGRWVPLLLLTLPHILWHIGPTPMSGCRKARGLCPVQGPLLKSHYLCEGQS